MDAYNSVVYVASVGYAAGLFEARQRRSRVSFIGQYTKRRGKKGKDSLLIFRNTR